MIFSPEKIKKTYTNSLFTPGISITRSAPYADISTTENRAQNFGMIGAAFGLGFIIGPLIGGLLGELGPRVPFFIKRFG